MVGVLKKINKIVSNLQNWNIIFYEDYYNENNSALQIDLILKLSQEIGGDKIYFDSHLIYENGKFICPNLVDLNAENLI